MDAGGSPDNAGSVTTYDTDRPFSAANLTFATLLQNDVLSAMNAEGWDIPDDGVVSDATEGFSVGDPATGGLATEAANYDHLLLLGPASPGYFSTPSQMPGAVIEPLYVTDPFEGSIAVSTRGKKSSRRGSPGLSRSTSHQPRRLRPPPPASQPSPLDAPEAPGSWQRGDSRGLIPGSHGRRRR